jgi:hypothetical protein
MRTLPRAALATALVAALLASAARASAQTARASATLVREAEAFMADYARDLRAGAHDRIVGRYDPRGAYLVGQGRKELLPLDSIRAIYRGGWSAPASFEWQDLSYEVAGPEAVVVIGRFVWGVSAERTLTFSYTSLLLRQDGRLRIRVEDESGAPAPRPPS